MEREMRKIRLINTMTVIVVSSRWALLNCRGWSLSTIEFVAAAMLAFIFVTFTARADDLSWQKIPPPGRSLDYDSSACAKSSPSRPRGTVGDYCYQAVRGLLKVRNYDAALRIYFSRCNPSVPLEERTCRDVWVPLPDNFPSLAVQDPACGYNNAAPPFACAAALSQGEAEIYLLDHWFLRNVPIHLYRH
jgi:hypothetical protein